MRVDEKTRKKDKMKTSADSSTVECSQRELRNNNKRWLPFFTYMKSLVWYSFILSLSEERKQKKRIFGKRAGLKMWNVGRTTQRLRDERSWCDWSTNEQKKKKKEREKGTFFS